MSLCGSLEDVTVADVLQFIHIGSRSGTLTLYGELPENTAEIALLKGRIVAARCQSSKRLGQLLVDQNAITQNDLDVALRIQASMDMPTALGRVLIDKGMLSREALRDAFERSVETTILEVIAWKSGSFEFNIDEIKPIDDLSLALDDVLEELQVNTQFVLFEAMRIIDERGRHNSKSPQKLFEFRDVDSKPSTVSDDDSAPTIPPVVVHGLSSIHLGETSDTPLGWGHRLPFITEDQALIEDLDILLAHVDASIAHLRLADGGINLIGELASVILVDMRDPRCDAAVISAIIRMRPDATIVAVIDPNALNFDEAYSAGATSVVGAKPQLVTACICNILRHQKESKNHVENNQILKTGTARLRRVLSEYRSGMIETTISLTLMDLISESVERVVMFAVLKNELVVMGAFGTTPQGEALAQKSRGMKIRLEGSGVLFDSVSDSVSRTVHFATSGLPHELISLIGRPRSGQCAVFPLLGSRKVVAAIYADNGDCDRMIDNVEFIDAATSQFGMFYENEILRRHLTNSESEAEAHQ